jgi:hypothetical protein
MFTSEMVKEAALAAGADLCGIGDMARFEGAPPAMDPRYLFPEAKTVIGMAFRIPCGVQRGIEEGTQFYQYPSMAYGGINEIFAPAVLYKVGKLVEDYGYEAFVYCNTGARGCVSSTESVKVDIAGKICEWGKLDEWKCYAFYTHGGRCFNPFVPKEVWDNNENASLDLLEGKVSANE